MTIYSEYPEAQLEQIHFEDLLMCAYRSQESKRAPIDQTSQQAELWFRHRDGLAAKDRETVERETAAVRAASGSRLAVASHLLVVRRLLCGKATNPKQKKVWSAYLAANLPGLAISRAQVFKDMNAAVAAQEAFSDAFLCRFVKGGYALNVRPTLDEPLGKFTTECRHLIDKLGHEPDESEADFLLEEASKNLKIKAKMNRPVRVTLSADEKRQRILADVHNSIIRHIEDLSQAVEPSETYSSTNLRDDLELIVGRLMTATQNESLELEPRALPDGYDVKKIQGDAADQKLYCLPGEVSHGTGLHA